MAKLGVSWVLSFLLAFMLLASAQAQQVVLQFWEGHSAQEEEATILMIEAFERANPDIRIERTKVSFGANFERITTALASGTEPDVSPIWSGFLTQFANAGVLLDITDHAADLEGEIYPAAWNFAQWQGRTYGIPYAIDPRFLVYSEEAFAEAGLSKPPRTFEELYEYAERLTVRRGEVVDRYGFALGEGEGLLNTFINFLYANGGAVINEAGTAVEFHSEAGVQAAEFLASLVSDGYATQGVAADNLRQAFLLGRVAMYIDGPWIFYEVANRPEHFDFGITAVPSATLDGERTNVASVGAYVVYNSTQHPKEAARFVTFLASPEAQQYRVQGLKTGVSRNVVDAPFAQEAFQAWPALAVAQDLLDESRIFPIHPQWSRVRDALVPALESIMSGSDAASTLQEAAREADRGLRR
jgi:ABC-type glycerol-3-phosphate transport system substrate-binding protein